MDWPYWTATATAAALNFAPYAAAPAAPESNGWILPRENMFFYDPTLLPFQSIPPPFQELFPAPSCILMPNISNIERRSAHGRSLSNVVVGNRSAKVDVDTDHVNGGATMREPGDVDMDHALDPDTDSIENKGTDLGGNPDPDSSSKGSQGILGVEGTRVDSGCQELDELLLQSAKEEVAGDVEGSADLDTRHEPIEISPLVCKTCRMTFNADRQARQHFSGKYHARRVKLRDPDHGSDRQHTSVNNESNADSSEESANDSSPPQISPDVYCSSCAVAFNSSKQAAQHYNGKLHCKRIRFQKDKDFISKRTEPERQRDDRHEASSPSPPFVCPACDKLFNTPRLLKRHLKYAQHPFKIGGKLTMFIRTTIPRWPFCP